MGAISPTPNETSNTSTGAYVIVARAPGIPWWEYVFVGGEGPPFQEIKDPLRTTPPFVFTYLEEAEQCLATLMEIKYRRGFLFEGAELKVIGLEDINKRALRHDETMDE